MFGDILPPHCHPETNFFHRNVTQLQLQRLCAVCKPRNKHPTLNARRHVMAYEKGFKHLMAKHVRYDAMLGQA